MGGLLASLQIALSGLQAQQTMMAVTAQNVANADNPAYAREETLLAPSPPYTPPALHQPPQVGELGTGVAVAAVTRQVSSFLQLQGWAVDGQLAQASKQAQVLGEAQALFNEPSTNGLGAALDYFWQDWSNLAANPQSSAARMQVLDQGQTVAGMLHNLSSGLSELQQNLDSTLVQKVQQVNQLAGEIAQLNDQIGAVVAGGENPNDLEDQRDSLVGQLAQLLPVQVSWGPGAEVTVNVGGVNLVAGTQTVQLQAVPNPADQGLHTLQWSNGVAAVVSGGAMGAMLQLRDQTLAGYLGAVNTLAAALAQAVNAQHSAGADLAGNPVATYQGGAYADFFQAGPVASASGPVTAANITVNPALVANPEEVAAAGVPSGGPGDGSNALALAGLAQQPFVGATGSSFSGGVWQFTGGDTPGDFYGTLVGQVGADTASAQSAVSDLQTLQNSIQNQQQQYSGVSTNSQMVRMVTAENAYAAAAKVEAAIATMLSDLMQMVP